MLAPYRPGHQYCENKVNTIIISYIKFSKKLNDHGHILCNDFGVATLSKLDLSAIHIWFIMLILKPMDYYNMP